MPCRWQVSARLFSGSPSCRASRCSAGCRARGRCWGRPCGRSSSQPRRSRAAGRAEGAWVRSSLVGRAAGGICVIYFGLGWGSRRLLSFTGDLQCYSARSCLPSGSARPGTGVQGFFPSLCCWFCRRKTHLHQKCLL